MNVFDRSDMLGESSVATFRMCMQCLLLLLLLLIAMKLGKDIIFGTFIH